MTIVPDIRSASRPEGRLRVAILGCTGSVGQQALDVCRKHADKLEVRALSVFTSTSALVRYAREFDVAHAAVASDKYADDPILQELPKGCEFTHGRQSVSDLAKLDDIDCVLVAMAGEGGIWSAYQGIVSGKIVACANKESLVSGGDLLMPLVTPGRFIPVDSEHSAIFQCLLGEPARDISQILLTCSGGPFFGWSRDELAAVTPEQALAHPTWKMGPKITIDSASLMNKGLEVIEAHHLFGVDMDDIHVLIHRQSLVHSMVEFRDGSVKAHIGPSDMRIPIQYALSYPERWESPVESMDFAQSPSLSFAEADTEVFRCLSLAYDAGRAGGTLPCAMNAANEVANQSFRDSEIAFTDIDGVVEWVMDATDAEKVESLAQLAEVNRRARALARTRIEEIRA